MRLSLLVVVILVIFTYSVEQRDALEDNPDDLENNYDNNQADFVNTETWEQNTTFVDESNLKGNETLEQSDATTLQYSVPKAAESETEKIQILDPDECGDPPPVKNAMIFEGSQIRYEVGAKVTYACEYGYITDGSVHFSECLLSDATQTLYWTDPETRCSPRSCGDPGYVEHAHREGSVFTFPNKISFQCDDGYTMRGYGIRYCQTSGTWSGNLPTCDPIFCDPPKNPENGRVSYLSLGYEAELHYECDPGFILKNDQGRTCSANGTWSGIEPTCQEAQCDSPTAPEHGTVQVIGDKSSVGSRALYTCDEGRVLVGSATSKCLDIGEWTFETPKCLQPCFIPKMQHGTIGRYVRYYRQTRFQELNENSKIEDNEELYLRCKSDYGPFGNPEKEQKVTCSHGEWKEVPVCKPAMCRDPPPPTQHATVSRANHTHGGDVVYLCKSYAQKVQYGNTTCNFGTWIGVRPVCKDLRCSADQLSFPGLIKGRNKFYFSGRGFTATCEPGFKPTKENNNLTCVNGAWYGHLPPCIGESCQVDDLVESQGIVSDGDKTVLNGVYLNVKCGEGYSPSGKLARCSKGQWSVTGKLCEESNCPVHSIKNGGFSTKVEVKKWNYLSFGYDRWSEYPKLNPGGIRSPGSWIYVSCNNGYSFQGKQGENNVSVKCSKGKWNPDPVCLPTGTPYRSEVRLSLDKAENTNTSLNVFVNKELSTTRQPLTLTTQIRPSQPDAALDHNKNLDSTPYPSCHCTYRNIDENLIAFVGNEQLLFASKVKNNDKIKFHCQNFGYYRLNGESELQCKYCRSWQSSDYPQCVMPQTGDTILQVEGDYRILPGGNIGVDEGKQLTVKCVSIGIQEYPEWVTSTRKRPEFSSYRDENGHFLSVLYISNAVSLHCGQYRCQMNGYRPSTFDIQVIRPPSVNCSKFDDRNYIIHYENDQAVNSRASFACKDNHKKPDGPNIVICQSNGQWSGGPPICKTICPKIQESEGMTISYTKGVDEGSIAVFHCLLPRTRSGTSRTTCMPNGEWSYPAAKCSLPNCSLDKLFDILPPNVVPDMEGVPSDALPYNFSLQLTCESNMMLIGPNVAKCGQDGSWQISKVQCVSACGLPRTENSELIIDPEKDIYRFGESVALSCSPGYVLSSEVVRLMCLGTSWSETFLPKCLKE